MFAVLGVSIADFFAGVATGILVSAAAVVVVASCISGATPKDGLDEVDLKDWKKEEQG